MMTMLGCPSRRRRAGLVLFTHLLLLGLSPMAEALHEHAHNWGPELHDAQDDCGHEGRRAECCLLLRTVPAVPAPPVAPGIRAEVSIAVALPGPTADLPDPSGSAVLPRAPPLG